MIHGSHPGGSGSVIFILMLILSSFVLYDTEVMGQDSDPLKLGNMNFEYRRLFRESDLLYRAAFGDIIPGNGHIEMATSSKNGRITVTYGSDVTWTTELATQVFIGDNPNDPAEVYSLAVHDLYPEYPGDEIISVDMDYNVRMTRYNDGEWISEVIFTDPGVDWLYEVAIGELVEEAPGPELVIVGDSQMATLVTRGPNGWTGEMMFKDNFGLDTCFIDDMDPSVPGNEVIVGGTDGNLTLISGSVGNWVNRNIASFGSPVIDVLTQDLDPTIPGKEIYASTFSGKVYMVYRDGEDFQKRMVHDEGAMAYGLEAGVIEGIPVVSMATWNSRVALLYYDSGFKVKEVYREDFYLIGTGIYDIDPYHKGNEIIGLSALGYLTMIYHDNPGVDLILPFNGTVVTINEGIDIPFILRYKGGFTGEATVTVKHGEPIPISYNRPGSHSFFLEGVSTPGTRRIMIEIEWEGGSKEVSLDLEVTERNGSISLFPDLIEGSVGADKQLVRSFSVLSNNDSGSPFMIRAKGLPAGIDVEISPDSVDAAQEPITVTSTVRVQPETEIMEHHFFIVGENPEGMKRAIGYKIDVQETSTADFDLIIQSPSFELSKGENRTFDLLVISTSGFNSEVEIRIMDPIEDILVTFSEKKVIPTATIQVTVEVLQDSGPYFIGIEGTYGTLRREDHIKIETLPPEKYLEIIGPQEPIALKKEDTGFSGEFIITLHPVNGVIDDLILKVETDLDNLSVSTNPASISRIPYRLNVTIGLKLDESHPEDQIQLNFTTGEKSWTYDVLLEYPDEIEDDPGFSLIIPVFIIVVIVLAVSIFIYTRRGNILNRDEGIDDDNGHGRGDHKVKSSTERPDGRTGGLDRLGRSDRKP